MGWVGDRFLCFFLGPARQPTVPLSLPLSSSYRPERRWRVTPLYWDVRPTGPRWRPSPAVGVAARDGAAGADPPDPGVAPLSLCARVPMDGTASGVGHKDGGGAGPSMRARRVLAST